MELIHTPLSQSQWAGNTLLDATVPQRYEDVIVLRPFVIGASLAGISGLTPNRLYTIINRDNSYSVNLAANNSAAPADCRFLSGVVLSPSKKTLLYNTGAGLMPIASAQVTPKVQVTTENVGTTTLSGSPPTVTIPSFVVTAAKLLFVFVSLRTNTDSVTGVTYGGVPLTRIITMPTGFSGCCHSAWALVNPPAGTANVVVSQTVATELEVVAVGVKDSASYGAVLTTQGQSGTFVPSLDVASADKGLTFDSYCRYNSNTEGLPVAPQVEVANVLGPLGNGHNISVSKKPSTGNSTNMSRTLYSVNIVGIGVTALPI